MVSCYECKKECRLIYSIALWNRLDGPPDFICEECSKDAISCDDEMKISSLITRKFISDNRPKRSKREDECERCRSPLYEVEGTFYCDSCLMRCSEHDGNIVREVQ